MQWVAEAEFGNKNIFYGNINYSNIRLTDE